MANKIENMSKKGITVRHIIAADCANPHPCQMCYVKNWKYAGPIRSKTTDEMIHDLRALRKQGYSPLIATKEIFTRNDWPQLLLEGGQKYVLTTGYLFIKDQSIFDTLLNIGIEQIVMSANIEPTAKILNIPDQEITAQVKKDAVEHGFSVMLSMIVTSENYNKLEEMLELAVEIGADTIRFIAYIPYVQKELAITYEQHKAFLEKTYEMTDHGLYPKDTLYISRGSFFSPYHRKSIQCIAGENSFTIGRDDHVYPCLPLVAPEFKIEKFSQGKLLINGDEQKEVIDRLQSSYCKAWDYFTHKKSTDCYEFM